MVIFYHEKREVIGCFQLLLLFFSWAYYFTAPYLLPEIIVCCTCDLKRLKCREGAEGPRRPGDVGFGPTGAKRRPQVHVPNSLKSLSAFFEISVRSLILSLSLSSLLCSCFHSCFPLFKHIKKLLLVTATSEFLGKRFV